MKKIQEIAKENCFDVIGNYADELEYSVTTSQLEDFAKGYMQDRLNSLEPVAWRHLHEDGWEYYDDASCEDCQQLYDISSLLEKE